MMKTDQAMLGAAGAIALAAFYLHDTRVPSDTEIGWRFANALRQRDAGAISAMFTHEELDGLGVTRAKATQIVQEIVLPYADLYTTNLNRITTQNRYLVFEKPHGDPKYIHPPTIMLTGPRQGEKFLSLGDLIGSIWGYRRADYKLGFLILDPRPQVRREFQRMKELGLTKSMNWSKHEVHDMPSEPIGY